MSPTSCQLLYPASMFNDYNGTMGFCQQLSENLNHIVVGYIAFFHQVSYGYTVKVVVYQGIELLPHAKGAAICRSGTGWRPLCQAGYRRQVSLGKSQHIPYSAFVRGLHQPVATTLAMDALYEAAKAAEGELVLVAVGPLTNVALARGKHGSLGKLLK